MGRQGKLGNKKTKSAYKFNIKNSSNERASFFNTSSTIQVGPASYEPKLGTTKSKCPILFKYYNDIRKKGNVKSVLTKLVTELKNINKYKINSKKQILNTNINYRRNDQEIKKLKKPSHFFISQTKKHPNELNQSSIHPGPGSYDHKIDLLNNENYFSSTGTFSKTSKIQNFQNNNNLMIIQSKVDVIPPVGSYNIEPPHMTRKMAMNKSNS